MQGFISWQSVFPEWMSWQCIAMWQKSEWLRLAEVIAGTKGVISVWASITQMISHAFPLPFTTYPFTDHLPADLPGPINMPSDPHTQPSTRSVRMWVQPLDIIALARKVASTTDNLTSSYFLPSFLPIKLLVPANLKKVLALDNSCQLWKEDDQSSLLIGKVDWAIIISALQKMVSVTRKYATSRKYASYCCPEKMPPVCIGSRNFPGYLSRTLLCKMSLKSVQKDALVNFQMFQQIATGLLPFLSCLP